MYIVSPNPTVELNTLAALGHTGTVQDVQFSYLRAAGYTGTLQDMLKAYLEAIYGVSWYEALQELREGSLSFGSLVLFVPSGSDSFITSDGKTFKVREY